MGGSGGEKGRWVGEEDRFGMYGRGFSCPNR